MRRMLLSTVLVLVLVPAASWGGEPALELAALTQAAAPQAEARLVAEIFASAELFQTWGSCSSTCDSCLLNARPNGADCPLDWNGYPQSCVPQCP